MNFYEDEIYVRGINCCKICSEQEYNYINLHMHRLVYRTCIECKEYTCKKCIIKSYCPICKLKNKNL